MVETLELMWLSLCLALSFSYFGNFYSVVRDFVLPFQEMSFQEATTINV